MRTSVLILAVLAWVLSCFDAVSYVRAGENESFAQAAQARTTTLLVARESAAISDNSPTQQNLEKDQLAIRADELALQDARKAHRDTEAQQQALAADQAKLQADRIVSYDAQEEARSNADPQIAAARENVDLYQKTAADWRATRERDVTLAHGLIGLWAVVIALGFWTARRRTGLPPMVAHGSGH